MAMKIRALIACAACALALPLAGCGGPSENEMRASFRTRAVDSCVSSARGSPQAGQFDWPRLCGCALDRFMAGKSASDLESADPHDPALRAATQQCATEQLGAAVDAGPPGAAENGAAPVD